MCNNVIDFKKKKQERDDKIEDMLNEVLAANPHLVKIDVANDNVVEEDIKLHNYFIKLLDFVCKIEDTVEDQELTSKEIETQVMNHCAELTSLSVDFLEEYQG